MPPQPTGTNQSSACVNPLTKSVLTVSMSDTSGVTDPSYTGKNSVRKKGTFKFARFSKKKFFPNAKKDRTVLGSNTCLSTEAANLPNDEINPSEKCYPGSNVIRGSDDSISQDRRGSLQSVYSVESSNTDYSACFDSGLVSLRARNVKSARYLFSKSLRASIAENGPSHESGSDSHEKLGDICVSCKEYNSSYLHYDAALEIMRTNKTKNRRFADILLKMAGVMLENGDKDEASDYYTEALPVLQHLEEEGNEENREREDVTELLIKIGYLHHDAGRHDDALTFFNNALSSKSADTKHDFSSVCMVMGLIYEKKNDYDTAIEYCTMSLSLKKTALGEYHPDVTNVLRKIGNVHSKKGQHESALDFYHQALIVLKFNAVDFQAALLVFDDIADIYKKTGDVNNAIDRYRDLLEAAKLSLGDKTDEVGTVLYRLACIHVDIGENDEAIRFLKQAERIKKENKSDLMQIATISIQIGSLYLAECATEKALLYYKDAIHHLSLVLKNDRNSDLRDGDLIVKLTQCEEALRTNRSESAAIPSPSFAEVTDVLNDMGNLYSLDASYKEAICCYESCLRIKMDIGSPDIDEVLKIRNNIGLAYCKLGLFDEAIVVFEKVLYTQKCANDNDCVESVMTLFHIGNVQLEKGFFREAIRFYQESVGIRRVELGSDHPDTLTATYQIGTAWLRMGAYEKSIMAFAEVLHLQKETLGENHEEIATTNCMIGVVHERAKHFDAAMKYYKESLRLRRDILGRNHPKVGKTLSRMAAVHYVQKEYISTKILCEEALVISKHETLSEEHPYIREVKHMIRKVDKKSSRLLEETYS